MEAASVPVWHYDGRSAARHAGTLTAQGDALLLQLGDAAPQRIEPVDLVARDDGGDGAGGERIVGLRTVAGWRLGLPAALPAEIARLLPRPARYGRIIDRIGLWPAVAASALVAAAIVALVLQTPALLARLIPASTERRLGDAMVGDLGNRTCNAPAGAAALARLRDRLAPGDAAIDLRVVNLPVVNAVTLPGGRVLLFDGLLRKAASADEVAGVVGHELGHVAHRDVLASLLRQLGLSVVLGGLGGNVGGYTNLALASSYSRGAEHAADGYAIRLLRDARISPLPTAAFFRRLSGAEAATGRSGRLLGYLASHPAARDRAAAFAASARGPAAPALSPADWQALRRICADDRDVEKARFTF